MLRRIWLKKVCKEISEIKKEASVLRKTDKRCDIENIWPVEKKIRKKAIKIVELGENILKELEENKVTEKSGELLPSHEPKLFDYCQIKTIGYISNQKNQNVIQYISRTNKTPGAK